MIITAITGKENVPNRVTSVFAFFCPSAQFPGESAHLFVKAKEPFPEKPVRAQGGANMVSARNGFKRELVGQWSTQVFDVDDGVILKYMARTQSGGLQLSGGVLLQAREGAALIRVTVPLSGRDDTPLSAAYIEGRFDVLDASLAVQEGVKGLSMADIKSFMPANRDRVMRVSSIAPEAVSRKRVETQVVENASGETVTVASAKRKRQIKI